MKAARIAALLAAARRHGEDSEPDHEVGDLQDCLRAALSLLTPEQLEIFYATEAVRDTLEQGGAE